MKNVNSYKGFQMLSKEAQQNLQLYEYAVISLMIILAITSIVWSLTMHILSGDFYNGFIGFKLAFRERDFNQLNEYEMNLLQRDLKRIINDTRMSSCDDGIKADLLIMSKESFAVTRTNGKFYKVKQTFHNSLNSEETDNTDMSTATNKDDYHRSTKDLRNNSKFAFKSEGDCKFLKQMSIDVHRTEWFRNVTVQFIYSFPFLSEIIAIVWTVMCFVFQSGVKKQWGLPKPWLIVMPSIVVFALMVVTNVAYIILANGLLKAFCRELIDNLNKAETISCGDAMSVLRPFIRDHVFSHDVYLNIFRISYIMALVLWTCALLIMIARFLLAIDFQLVDIEIDCDTELPECDTKGEEFVEILLQSPVKEKLQTPQTLTVTIERPKSEDDFLSAKSHFSDMGANVLENLNATQKQK
ncbi:uncharacterized protein LOC119634338 [Glossina fuscipes]|uniref:Uncharacterized protein LOC119634338 n=1 Tax=Glossina fuscipes TaxID=7396 RepID=A0A8U0WGX6_9MUSC|nr:uncharacterized protein LOC119634338 [Glossina fuscipes]